MTVQLTEEQKQAVVNINGNVVAIASAGSGKTSAFTTRIAYMIKKNINPSCIMAITFTKKASEEMIKRLAKLVGKEKAKKVTIGTTHAVFYKLLKELDSDFSKYSIIPDWNRFSIMRDLCEPQSSKNHLGLGIGIKAGQLAGFISYQKSNLITPKDKFIFDDVTSYVNPLDEDKLREAYKRYEYHKANSRQIDFDDMLMYMYVKLKSSKEFKEELNKRFEYVMIDEFQDSSMVVSEIIKMINDRNVFVVGDFRQSIYSFMNSKVDNIFNFENIFKDVMTIEMNKNFRSTQNIVNFSNDIISHSPIDSYKKYKMSESVAEVGSPVRLTAYQDVYKQINHIAELIEKRLEDGIPASEIAVLVRTNAQSGILEERLSELDIPYELSKTMSFFDKREVMDILAYLKLSTDYNDNDSFRRVYNTPNRYLSKRSLEQLETEATEANESLWSTSTHSDLNKDWKFNRNIQALKAVIVKANEMNNDGESNKDIINYIIKATGYEKYIHDNSQNHPSAVEKIESIHRLAEMSKRFPTPSAFLTNISIIKDKQSKSKGNDTVKLSTIHSSKGLEWHTVFVVDVNLDLLPHAFNGDIEEERRLFYVACSRPKKELFVSWCVFDGDDMTKVLGDSVFIKELIGDKKVAEMKSNVLGKPFVSIEY